MKFLILIFIVSPIYASSDVLSESRGPHVHFITAELIRERRQTHGQAQQINYRPLSQAPAQIKQLLQSQLAREPIRHIPAQPPPQLAPAGRPDPRYQTQAQVSQYRPQVQYANAPQQPTYKDIPVAPAQYRQPAPAAPSQQRYTSQAQPNYRATYQPIQAPAAPQQPHYSTRLPPQLQQLLQIQQQLPNAIPQGPPGGQQSKIYQPQQRAY